MLKQEILKHCARCGSCTTVCPTYEVSGRESLTARGKLHLICSSLAENPSTNYQDIFAACLLCGACEQACPRNINIRELIVEARSRFPILYGPHGVKKSIVRTALSHPGLLEGLVRAGLNIKKLSLLPAGSGLRLRLGLLEKDRGVTVREVVKKSPSHDAGKQVNYFTGCHAKYLQPSVAEATVTLCREVIGINPGTPDTQVCCGLAAWSSGRIEEARRLARENITAFENTKGPVLASCASCSSFLKSYPNLFEDEPDWKEKAASFGNRVTEFSSFFLPFFQQSGQWMPRRETILYYHEPCHLRFDARNRQATHKLLDCISSITRLDSEESSYCCGQGGLFHIGYPELSEKIFSRVYANMQDEEQGVVVTTCSGCLMQWQSGLAKRESRFEAQHLAVFLAGCLGH